MSTNLPISKECPSCDLNFINCSLLEKSKGHLSLQCDSCMHTFSLENTKEQCDLLSEEYGVPSQIVQVKDIKQLREGDAISFKRASSGSENSSSSLGYQHHAITVAIDNEQETVDLVEFLPKEVGLAKKMFENCIRRKKRKFKEDIADQNAWLRQYMPLDCYPRLKVVEIAKSFIENPGSQPKYDITRFNCQHLTSWIKAGILISNEAESARKWYVRVMGSAIAVSTFCYPSLADGLLAVDSASRVVRICRTSFDLISKGIDDPSILKKDLKDLLVFEACIRASVAATAALGSASVITTVATVGVVAASVALLPITIKPGVYKVGSWISSSWKS